jgi:hypothetical protein
VRAEHTILTVKVCDASCDMKRGTIDKSSRNGDT